MNRAFYCRTDADSCAEAALPRLNVANFAMLVVGAVAVVAQSFAAFADDADHKRHIAARLISCLKSKKTPASNANVTG
jgi:hypothetical protein